MGFEVYSSSILYRRPLAYNSYFPIGCSMDNLITNENLLRLLTRLIPFEFTWYLIFDYLLEQQENHLEMFRGISCSVAITFLIYGGLSSAISRNNAYSYVITGDHTTSCTRTVNTPLTLDAFNATSLSVVNSSFFFFLKFCHL